jgi:2-methylaconitate cis-trans-isomerase PrpF
VCTAAVASVARSVVQKALRRARPDELRIGHPLGAMRVVAQARSDHPDGLLRAQDPLLFERLGFSRTARCLMKGVASVPNPAALAVRQMKEVS